VGGGWEARGEVSRGQRRNRREGNTAKKVANKQGARRGETGKRGKN